MNATNETMAMYKREFNAPLSRYNARKRELQTSMLEYSERVKTLNAIQEKNLLSDNLGLEIRARRHHLSRHSDPDLITHANQRYNHHVIRQRPHSLDDKELLRNRKLNQSLLAAARRDVKSEYGQPIVIPTHSSSISNVSNPPNSPDIGGSSNVRLNLVSTSDLYDLVDFGQSPKSSPRRNTSRVSCGKDGMKLIEQIDIRSRNERKTAWGNNKTKNQSWENGYSYSTSNYLKKDTQYSESGANNVLGGYITGKSIKNRSKGKTDSKNDANEAKENHIPNKKPAHSKKSVAVVTTADKNEIYPLNVFLETVLSSCKEPLGKMRSRPKRAKRMQLHKSDLVVIPEDGDTASNNREDAYRRTAHDNNYVVQRSSTPVPSNASLTAIKEGISRHKKQQSSSNFSKRDYSNNESDENIKTGVSISDGSVRSVHKHKKKRQSSQTLDAIIVKNSIMYPNLPWESDHSDLNTTVVNFDTSQGNGKNRRVKRLVFLRDQQENTYHH